MKFQLQLQRNEVIALLNLLNRLSESLKFVHEKGPSAEKLLEGQVSSSPTGKNTFLQWCYFFIGNEVSLLDTSNLCKWTFFMLRLLIERAFWLARFLMLCKERSKCSTFSFEVYCIRHDGVFIGSTRWKIVSGESEIECWRSRVWIEN